MSKLTIITNNIPRELHALASLPDKVRKDFDYIKEEDAYSLRMVKYKGVWYDVYDTMANRGMGCAPDGWDWWDSHISDSFFSGLLFKVNFNDESVIIGRYFS